MSIAEKIQATRASRPLARPSIGVRASDLGLAALMGGGALLVFLEHDPLNRIIEGDPGIFLYISKMVAEGIAPHVSALNEQASLAFLIGGAAIRLSDVLRIPELIGYRIFSLSFGALIVALTYLVAYSFSRVRAVAITSALLMLSFRAFGMRAATALDPKFVMLVFGLAALLMIMNRHWFWAGCLSACSGLGWQFGWGYFLVALLLALIQGRPRGQSVARVLVGFAIPIALYVLYFAAHGALAEMWEQSFVYPFVVGRSDKVWQFGPRLGRMVSSYLIAYRNQVPVAVLGLIGSLAILARAFRSQRSFVYLLFRNRRTASVLLAFAGYAFYSLLDFQNYPDWFPLLPFLAIFGAWCLWTILKKLGGWARVPPGVRKLALPVVASVLVLALVPDFLVSDLIRPPKVTWQNQAAAAEELNQRLSPAASVLVLGRPELLVFMGRRNLSPVIYLLAHTDLAIDKFEPGGYDGFLRAARTARPELIVLSRLRPRDFVERSHYAKLMSWIRSDYVSLKTCRGAGRGSFLVRADLSEQWQSNKRASCFDVR